MCKTFLLIIKYIMNNETSIQQEFGLVVVGALIFVTSFLWKDLIMDIQNVWFPKEISITKRILFTSFITIIIILIVIYLRRYLGLAARVSFDDTPIENNNN